MISKGEVLRRGVISALEENAKERRTLLALIGVKEKRETAKTGVELLAALEQEPESERKPKGKARKKYTRKHWTQRPENRKRVVKMAKARAALRGATQ